MASALVAQGYVATNTISITVNAGSPSPIVLTNPTFNGTKFSFSFATQAGFPYRGQFTTSLQVASNNWTTFTNLSGNGSVVQITDFSRTNNQRFYSVQAF